MRTIILAVSAAFLLSACAAKEKVVALGTKSITYYCQAGELERNALRAEFTTSKGPLVEVHCENLE